MFWEEFYYFKSKFWPESLTGPKSNAQSIYTTKHSTETTDTISGLHEERGKESRKGDGKS